MLKLIDSYIDYLSKNPDKIESIVIWAVVNSFVYWSLIKYRERMIAGASGENGFFEPPEHYAYFSLYVVFAIVTFSAFFKYELPMMMWYFIIGLVAYVMGGRWLFDWALEFLGRKNSTTETKSTTIKHEEVKVEEQTDGKNK